MKLTSIISNRNIDPHHANDLVYEWEDELCRYFKVKLFYNHALKNERYSKYIPFILNWFQTNKPAFTYEMCTYRHNGNNKGNIVPCIVDFYLHKPWQIRLWYWQYWRNPVICVSSREVYAFLREQMGLKKIYHLPLSLSDKYRITEDAKFEKRYDILIAGRQNAILKEWLTQYMANHPDTTYLRRDIKNGQPFYINQNGDVVIEGDSRDIYMQLMRQTRAGIYAPPGVDGGRKTNGFHQVTPRFLEIIASGCHPLMRYPMNADTDYFQLSLFGPHLESYEQFEAAFDAARKESVDMKKYADYMSLHYTSVVAKQLEQILSVI